MVSGTDVSQRCAALLKKLDRESGWRLSEFEHRAYVHDLVGCLSQGDLDDTELCVRLHRYHEEHAYPKALSEPTNPNYDSAWKQWMNQALRILRSEGLTYLGDSAMDTDDLIQVAMEELIRALPTFQYASRFSTWAYTVIVRSIRRRMRDLRAAKRSARVASLEQEFDHYVPVEAAEHPVDCAEANALAKLIDDILLEYTDERVVTIFRLWSEDDQRLIDIGRQVHLSPSRVSVLLEHARALLRQSPQIIEWVGLNQ